MTTVSLVEIKTPLSSLRTCGSSVSSLVHQRTRLQCSSPEKRRPTAAYKTRTPDVRGGRVSVSPKVLGLEGTQLVSSPAETPIPRPSVTPYSGRQSRIAYDETKVLGLEGTQLVSSPAETPIPRPSVTPYSGRQSRIAYDEFSSSESLDEFSGEESGTDEDVQADAQKLFVVGSRQHLHGPYDVPNIVALKPTHKSEPAVNVREPSACKKQVRECDHDSDTSPDNPPPSPINFRPSLEGFVVGGQKLTCPQKSGTTLGNTSHSRDFVPGFVKYPLYHCTKCEGKVVEEEQTEVALQRRRSCLLQSRISTHIRPDDTIRSVGSRIGRDSQMLCGSLDGLSPSFMSPEPSSCYDKTFIEIYMEKKKLKEEKDREIEQEKQRKREKRRKDEKMKKKGKSTKAVEKKGLDEAMDHTHGQDAIKRNLSDDLTTQSYEKMNQNSDGSDAILNKKQKKKQHDLCSPRESHTRFIPISKTMSRFKHNCQSSDSLPEVEKLQIRRCWSDIWPFPGEIATNSPRDEDDLFSFNLGSFRCKSRITPFHPLRRSPALMSSESNLVSCASLMSNQSNHAISRDDVVERPTSLPAGVITEDSKVAEPSENDLTMTATVMVPPRDTDCNQWISFSADNEPVLNNSPEVDDGCDTFLKRLQRTKLSNTDPSMPMGQQFCFQAVVDKRYNRWKRRKRKKREGELRRAVRPPETESSDENDERNTEVEQILDRMYDQIHGPAPLTPNGTRDTPRFRNRRRRKEAHDVNMDVIRKTSDPTIVNYDASSEWTSSDKDSQGHLSSNSGLGQCVENTAVEIVRKSADRRNSDDMCYWPFIEQYKQEMLKKIQNTPQDQLEAMDQKDWLPDISSHYNGRVSKSSQRSEKDEFIWGETDNNLDQSSAQREESDSTITGLSAKVKRPSVKQVDTKKISKDAKVTSNMYKKWSRSNVQSVRHSFPPGQNTKLLSRTGASSWGEMGSSPNTARPIGVVEVGPNTVDNTFKASLRPIKRDDVTTTDQQKLAKKPTKEQPKVKSTVLNLPALSKNIKSQTFPVNVKKDSSTKGKRKPQTPVGGKSSNQKHYSRPKTQPMSTNRGATLDQYDPNLIFRDYYLKTLYTERMRINSHVSGKNLKKTITVDQLDIGGRKTQTDSDKLSDLAFTRSFTFSMFDLPEVYKMYNANLIQRANGQAIETSD